MERLIIIYGIISSSIGISLLAYTYIRRSIGLHKASKGQLPRRLQDFPYYEADYSRYLTFKSECKEFIDSAFSGQTINFQMSASYLNEMYLKGNTKSKYEPNRHKYYEIINNTLIEKVIQWPVNSWDGCSFCYRHIDFYRQDNIWHQKSHYYSSVGNFNPYNWEDEQIIFLRDSIFLLTSFGLTDSVFLLKRNFPDDYERFTKLIERLNTVEVSNGKLTLSI